MRVISQDGRIDLPYEQIVVENNTVDKITIIAYAVDSYDDTVWKLAEYSTEEKAEKAMKTLRTEYERHYQTYLDGMKEILFELYEELGTYSGAWTSGTIRREKEVA